MMEQRPVLWGSWRSRAADEMLTRFGVAHESRVMSAHARRPSSRNMHRVPISCALQQQRLTDSPGNDSGGKDRM